MCTPCICTLGTILIECRRSARLARMVDETAKTDDGTVKTDAGSDWHSD